MTYTHMSCAALLAGAFFGVSCGTMSDGEGAGSGAMSQEEMMARMQQLGAPGEGHQRLQPLVGKFKTVGQFWMEPGAEPIVTEGTSTNTWILGGRFLRQDFRGPFMGVPFEGIGTTGFNNATQQYEGTWIDNMGTLTMPVSTGTVDDSGRAITFVREFDHPMTGQRTKTREVLTITDANTHTFEWFETSSDGVEAQTMQIVYTRIQ